MELNVDELNAMLDGVVVPQLSPELCIYKVPERIRKTNPQAFTPHIIAIGPFHHPPPVGDPPVGGNNPNPPNGINNLREMERLKLKYVRAFLDRTGILWDRLFEKLKELEIRIRNSYAEHFTLNSKEFLKIILVDACFIIEHFYRYYNQNRYLRDDPIFSKPGLCHEIEVDLLLLENQLPFFVLDEIYRLGNLPAVEDPFIQLTMRYFQELNRQRLEFQNIHPRHFTDLQRTFFLPIGGYERQNNRNNIIRGELFYSASQLSDAGLKFQLRGNQPCLLNMNFLNGVLHMPCFNVSDTIETDMKNLLAFEECHISELHTKYISQYIRILDFLINTEKDVNILVDNNIIVHRLGDAKEVATLINNLAKNISLPEFFQRYIDMFQGLNDFANGFCNSNKAVCYRDYCSTPFKIVSTTAAIGLLLLTCTQTVFSIWAVVKQK